MKFKTLLIQFGVGLVLTAVLAVIIGTFKQTETADIIRYLSDSFAATGILLLCVSGLSLTASTGFFDIYSYGIRKGMHNIFPGTLFEYSGSYYDYLDEKREQRKKRKKVYMFIPGAALVAVAGILTIIWYNL